MSVRVKICGLKTEAPLVAALDAGADYVGFVNFERSPRHVTAEQVAELASLCKGRSSTVCLFVNPTDEEISKMLEVADPDLIQLHGDESPERVRFIRNITARPVIKALGVSDPGDLDQAASYEKIADMVLYDAKPPEGTADTLPGGNGIPFDWEILSRISPDHEFMLSGGLNPDNVGEAIRITKPAIVDVSSGVESAPGHKDPDLIRQFIREVRETTLDLEKV